MIFHTIFSFLPLRGLVNFIILNFYRLFLFDIAPGYFWTLALAKHTCHR